MRIGITLPNMGPSANPEAVVAGARRAEALGYDSVWAIDRMLYPVRPRTPYPASPDGRLPDFYRAVLEPLSSLTFAAAHTERIGLGTSILDIPFYNPVVLARQLTTLDVLSKGRLRLGFGLGWSEDEFEAVGVPMKERGARADELLRCLRAIWTTDPVSFEGRFFRLAPSIIGPKPVQKPHPPFYLAAFVPAAMRRAATQADGWFPHGVPLDALPEKIEELRAMGREAGRADADLGVVLVVSVELTTKPLGAGRRDFTGSALEVRSDVERARALGLVELVFELHLDPPTSELLATMERLRPLAGG